MKLILSFLLILSAGKIFAQSPSISVFIRDQALMISLDDDDNKDKILQINPKQFTDNDVLKIRVNGDSTESEWNRNFFINDEAGNSVKDFTVLSDKTYTIRFSEMKRLMQKQKTYFIYTTAIPTDPQKAMLVKPGKKLVCSIKIL